MIRSVARLLAFGVVGLLGWALVVACTVDESAAPERVSLGASYVTASVTVAWRATCGTVTSGGLYTAPSTTPTSGRCLVIATRTDNGAADTGVATIASAEVVTGIPFGPTQADASECGSLAAFSGCMDGVTPSNVVARINAARSAGKRLMLAMTGGSHDLYMTNGVFDMAKWRTRMDGYRPTTIRDALVKGVADGTITGNSVMDEPFNTTASNNWGPAGTMTKARVDSMCAYVKTILPTMPAGAFHSAQDFEPTKTYTVCDLFIAQYRQAKGDVTTWRDVNLASATRQHMTVAFSLNVLDGGQRDNDGDGLWECPQPLTGGKGTYAPNCRMTAPQILTYGGVLGPAGCALLAWRFEADYFGQSAVQSAVRQLSGELATRPGKRCVRT